MVEPSLTHSRHPGRVTQKEERVGETRAPRECTGLGHRAELGALPRHPDSALAQSRQRKGPSDVAWGIVQSRVFVVQRFVFLLLLLPSF